MEDDGSVQIDEASAEIVVSEGQVSLDQRGLGRNQAAYKGKNMRASIDQNRGDRKAKAKKKRKKRANGSLVPVQ